MPPPESIEQYVQMTDLKVRDDAELLTSVLTEEEKEIVRELLTTTKGATDVIPDDIAPEDLWRYLAATCKGVRRVDDAKARLKFWLGRMLVKIQEHPKLFEAQGYSNFNDFVTVGLSDLFGVSRNEGYVVKRISEQLGDRLTVEEMSEIGISNLALAATALRQKLPDGVPVETREKEIDKWINLAKTKPVKEMKQIMADESLIEQGELDFTALNLTVQKPVAERWKQFRKQPWVQAKAGGSDTQILDSLMSEASTWEAEFNEQSA